MDLAKVLHNVKEDTVSFRHLSEKLYHSSTIQPPTPTTQYIVFGLIPITGLLAFGFLSLFWWYRIIKLTLSLTHAPIATALTYQRHINDKNSDKENQLLYAPTEHYLNYIFLFSAITAFIATAFVIYKLMTQCYNRCTIKHFCVTWPKQTTYDVILQIGSTQQVMSLYVTQARNFLRSMTAVKQNRITKVSVDWIIPFIIYQVTFSFQGDSLLVHDNDRWVTPNTVYVGYFTATNLTQITRQTPCSYRILIGHNGIYETPPVKQDSPQLHRYITEYKKDTSPVLHSRNASQATFPDSPLHKIAPPVDTTDLTTSPSFTADAQTMV